MVTFVKQSSLQSTLAVNTSRRHSPGHCHSDVAIGVWQGLRALRHRMKHNRVVRRKRNSYIQAATTLSKAFSSSSILVNLVVPLSILKMYKVVAVKLAQQMNTFAWKLCERQHCSSREMDTMNARQLNLEHN